MEPLPSKPWQLLREWSRNEREARSLGEEEELGVIQS